ncbi:MAG: hypothetical protein GX053_11115 [Tissierella sp.]|nr:hypothetical protein [Tissierella sp.]
MNKKILRLILIGVLFIIIVANFILLDNNKYNLVNKSNKNKLDKSQIQENIDDKEIDTKSNFPYGEDGLLIEGNEETEFNTKYAKNYFRVAFQNNGENDVSIWITSPTNPNQYYKLEIPASSYNDVYFAAVDPNSYLLDITGDRGGECIGILGVEIRNTSFE